MEIMNIHENHRIHEIHGNHENHENRENHDFHENHGNHEYRVGDYGLRGLCIRGFGVERFKDLLGDMILRFGVE